MSEQIVSSIESLDWRSFLNRGLYYGDGLFETMRVSKGRIPLWDFHWQRLKRSAEIFLLDLPSEKELKAVIENWVWISEQSILKLTLFRKEKGRGYLAKHRLTDWVLQASVFKSSDKKPFQLGLAQLRLAEQPKLAGHKHLNRLEQVVLAQELSGSGFDELIVSSQSGWVTEVVSQNVIFIKGDQLFTPDVTLCGVAGVGIGWLKSLFQIDVIDVKVDELDQFDSMILINSVRGITQVESVEGVKKYITHTPLHDRINRLWNELMGS